MAYLGNAPVVGDSTNSFRLLDDIASFTLTFDATDTAVVSIANDTLSFTNHRFVNGQKVTYTDGGGTAIGGLTDGTSYFIIKVDQNTIKLATNASNAASSTAINLTSGAAGGSHTLNVKFDGVNTKFKATFNNGKKAKISRAAQLSLSINGVVQQPQDSSSPSVGYGVEADSTIVFSTAPVATDVVFGSFIGEVAASFDLEDNTVDNFTGDGSTTIFNLSKEVPSSQDVLVTIDGVTQYPSDGSTTRAYSVIDQALTFVSAPADGTAIQARHIGFAGATTSAVTGFYGRTGNAALINTDDISVQNISGVGATFTSNVNIEGVLTYEDVTNVDSVGLITARSGISVSGGDIKVGSATTLSQDNIFTTGIVTATSFDGSLNASQISSGTVPTARLGSGTASSSTFLRGDSTFQTVNTDLVSDTSPQLGGTLDTNGNNIQFGDSETAQFGDSQEFQMWHDGTNSHIKNATGAGIFQLRTDNFRIVDAAIQHTYLTAVQDGAVELYYDNSKKLETTANGVGLVGNLHFHDNEYALFGNANDLQIYHDGSYNWIKSGVDGTTLHIDHDLTQIRNHGGTEVMAKFIENGAVELYYDNSKKIETTSGGALVTGNLYLNDNGEFTVGTGGDFKIYHDGSNSFIVNQTGNLVIRSDNRIDFQDSGGNESFASFIDNGAVELYYNGTKKFETTSSGTKTSAGTLEVNGPSGTSYTLEVKPLVSTPYGLRVLEPSSTSNGYPLLAVTENDGTTLFRVDSGTGLARTRKLEPVTDNTYDLGSSSKRYANLYTTDLQLSNEGKSNDVDGTWGNYTIQEGENDLFLINNRSGKKYKFNLTEVS